VRDTPDRPARAETRLAVGGTEALRTLDSQCAKLLLEQIRTNDAAM
jgi:hypothetical protein